MRNSALLLAILAALPACETTVGGTGCMNVPPEQATCPNDPDPSKLSYITECGDFEITEVNGPGTIRIDFEVSKSCCPAAERFGVG